MQLKNHAILQWIVREFELFELSRHGAVSFISLKNFLLAAVGALSHENQRLSDRSHFDRLFGGRAQGQRVSRKAAERSRLEALLGLLVNEQRSVDR